MEMIEEEKEARARDAVLTRGVATVIDEEGNDARDPLDGDTLVLLGEDDGGVEDVRAGLRVIPVGSTKF